ncbi:2Fe-2S Ferredoxin [Carpediemonas membranifera]|uniref:2Fe-2S Ferredoxin n=1 Tax=Carpediemonas membranifera TaxID=201153 RepID=A0A8J6E857_9EUKA|nr:2Fe-2S Ferredoxin [Carpediemonas membranifera]|eukprot:KAG9391450.1 2Fe-2S Ferredoxin [Carpediemonas membranifera]
MLSTLSKTISLDFARMASTVTIKYPGVPDIAAAVGERLDKVLKEAVPGFKNSCNGAAVCTKCMVSINTDHLSKLPPVTEDEADGLEDVDAEPNQRLTCQINVTNDMDGLEIIA